MEKSKRETEEESRQIYDVSAEHGSCLRFSLSLGPSMRIGL